MGYISSSCMIPVYDTHPPTVHMLVRVGHVMVVLSIIIRRAMAGPDTIRSHQQGWSSVLFVKSEKLPRDITPRVIGPWPPILPLHLLYLTDQVLYKFHQSWTTNIKVI